MAVRMMELLGGNLGALRYEPTAKRIRVCLGGEAVAETREARLVWEPGRVVPTYAVPTAALSAQLVPAGAESGDDDDDVGVLLPSVSAGPILDPDGPVREALLRGHRLRRHRRRGDGCRGGLPAG